MQVWFVKMKKHCSIYSLLNSTGADQMNQKKGEVKIEKPVLSYIDEREENEQEELYYKLWEDDRN
jgi:hypothetical protein